MIAEDDDEEMYDDEYGDELDYGDEDVSDDGEGVSDEDEELGEMGEIEGLRGEPGVVEVIMDEDDDMDEDEDEMSEDDEMDSDDMEDMEDHLDVVEEIVDEDGNPIDDDGASGWESEETDEEEDDEDDDDEDVDYEAEIQDADEAHMHGMEPGDIIDNLARAVMDPEDYEGDDMDDLGDHYIDDGRDDDGETPASRVTFDNANEN